MNKKAVSENSEKFWCSLPTFWQYAKWGMDGGGRNTRNRSMRMMTWKVAAPWFTHFVPVNCVSPDII